MRKKFWLVGSISLVLVLLLLFWLLHSKNNAQEENQYAGAQVVEVAKADSIIYQQHIDAVGEILPWEEATISSDLSGVKLQQTKVQLGDKVKKGQVLALLDDAFIKSELKLAQAQRSKAVIALQNATNNAARIRALQDSGALSKLEVEQYLAQEKTAQAQLQAIEAQLANQQLRLDHTKIIAVDDGIISQKFINLGEMVNAGQPLFKLIRQERIEWQAKVGSQVITKIKPGLAAEITDAQGQRYQGTVRLISPVIDPKTRDAIVFVQLPELKTASIPAGSFVQGRFIFPEQQGLAIEQTALLMRDGKTWVFVLAENSTVKQQEVVIGPRSNNKIVIVKGIQAEDEIVQRGGEFLYDGSQVTLFKAPAASKKDQH